MSSALPHFDGPEYDPDRDQDRLSSQIDRIFNLMSDSAWRTLDEISELTGDPPASISAQLRHLRKPRFGSHVVNRRSRRGNRSGLYEYQLIVTKEGWMDTLFGSPPNDSRWYES